MAKTDKNPTTDMKKESVLNKKENPAKPANPKSEKELTLKNLREELSKRSGEGHKYELKLDLSSKNIMKWVFIVLGIVFLVVFLAGPLPSEEKPISQILEDTKAGKISEISVEGENLVAKYKEGDKLVSSRKETSDTLLKIFADNNIDLKNLSVEIKSQSFYRILGSGIEILLPLLVTAIIFLFIFNQMRGAQDSVFSFGKNKAKLFMKGKQDVRFADVGGVNEVKSELEEIVDFLKNPKKYNKMGAKTPKGALLVGPAGTGKTLLARAVAGEAGVPFLSMAGSEFMEMLVGVGASRVRDLFTTAKKVSPSIIFIDEIDAIGRQRGMGTSGGHDEREQTLNQILVEMDGFTPRDNVIVLAATNRGDLLDSALLRPGRFDRTVTLDLPDLAGRKHILGIHAKNKPFVADINWDLVAKRTVGFSGADLENMLNEAAINAARESCEQITYKHVEEAATKVKMGPQKRRLQTEEERRMTAYHEAGHALCAFYMKNTDPVYRVSIISRGRALGYTQVPPERDKYQETRSEMLDQLVMMLGGRAAEELEFNELTGGASSDISSATNVARRMVVDYGMSPLGPIQLSSQVDTSNYRSAYYKESQLSEKMQAEVDSEMKAIIDRCYKVAMKTLTDHKDKLDLISKELLEKETLEADEFEKLMKA